MKTVFLLLGACAVLASACDWDLIDAEITAKAPVQVLERPEPITRGPNRVIGILPVGSSVHASKSVVRKDFMAYEVKLPDGAKGFIISDPSIDVVDHRGPR